MIYNPRFGSGPCAKPYPCADKSIGRSHISSFWRKKNQKIVASVKQVLEIPASHHVYLVPGSTTGAMEMLLWNLLGPHAVHIVVFDVFSQIWYDDIQHELRCSVSGSQDPVFAPNRDCVFVANGTTSGVQVRAFDWIPQQRSTLTICDAASAVFCMNLPWHKLDATAFSFQKGLGSEGSVGAIVLSERAVQRIQTHTPSWPLPYNFRIKNRFEQLQQGYFINTPSLLALQDIERCLEWALSIGGLPTLTARTERNYAILTHWIHNHLGLDFHCRNASMRSHISPCFVIKHFKNRSDYEKLADKLEEQDIAYDIIGHYRVDPCFRLWCGPTVEEASITSFIERIEAFL